MYTYAYHLAGRTYNIGYQSRVCSSPRRIGINSITGGRMEKDGSSFEISHYHKRKFERGATSKMVLEAVKNPVVCLNQWNGRRVVYVTPEITVVMTAEGAIVTVWTGDDYGDDMRTLLADAGYQ